MQLASEGADSEGGHRGSLTATAGAEQAQRGAPHLPWYLPPCLICQFTLHLACFRPNIISWLLRAVAAVLDIAMPRSATRRYAAPVTLLLALAFMLTPANAECNYLGADLPAMVPEP